MTDAVVLGAGVIGLSTASALLDRGMRVEVWSRDDTLATTSAAAGAIWHPFLAEPRDKVLRWAAATFQVLRGLAEDPSSGVRMVRAIEVLPAGAPDPAWSAIVRGARRVGPHDLPKGCSDGAMAEVPLCETPVYLPWLRKRVERRGVRFVQRQVQELREALEVAPVVVNCTGLGARELCGDRSLEAARGQVVCVEPVGLRQALIDDGDPDLPVYLLPRSNDIVLGGTVQLGDERLAADDGETASIVERCARLWPAVAGARVRAVKVGLRPWRPEVRVEVERVAGRGVVVHNYGHGGSGFTLSWGCAEEAAGLVMRQG